MRNVVRNALLPMFVGAGVLVVALAARAEDPFYYGRWQIIEASAAPWVKNAQEVDQTEASSLVGQTITLSADAVDGPGDFPCAKPHYEVIEGPAETLFQGMFGQMHDEDAAVDPQKLAEQAGFEGKDFRTVITGCEYAIDFSFGADADVAMFALNNVLYVMQRE